MQRKEIPKFDASPYVGTKTEIVKAEIKQGKYGAVILVETAPIKLKEGDSLPDGKSLRASIMLGLVTQEDGSFAIGIDSKTDKFMKQHKIDYKQIPDNLEVGDLIKAFEGKQVICQLSENGFLTIA